MKTVLFLASFGLALCLSLSTNAGPITLTCDGKNAAVPKKVTDVVGNPYCCGLIVNRQSCLEDRVAALKDLRNFIKPYYDDINLTPCGNMGSGPAIDSEGSLPAGASVDQLVSMVDTLVGFINQGDAGITNGINTLQQMCH